MPDRERIRDRPLTVIAGLLAVAALKWSYPVTMPLAVTAFIAAAWPIKPWLDRVLPYSLSYASTLLALLAFLAGFFAAVYLSLAEVVQTLARRQEQFQQRAILYSSATGRPSETLIKR
jgi:predicted PurR-regulated permease PerM